MNKKTIMLTACLLTASVWAVHAADPSMCSGCHGANGEGMGPNPKISGLPEDQFIKAMNEYKDGTRPHAGMKAFVAPLSDQDIADLAKYYAGK